MLWPSLCFLEKLWHKALCEVLAFIRRYHCDHCQLLHHSLDNRCTAPLPCCTVQVSLYMNLLLICKGRENSSCNNNQHSNPSIMVCIVLCVLFFIRLQTKLLQDWMLEVSRMPITRASASWRKKLDPEFNTNGLELNQTAMTYKQQSSQPWEKHIKLEHLFCKGTDVWYVLSTATSFKMILKHAECDEKNCSKQKHWFTQCGARTHDHKIKSLALCQLS